MSKRKNTDGTAAGAVTLADLRTMEERIIAHIDAVHSKIDALESRVGALESKIDMEVNHLRQEMADAWRQTAAHVTEQVAELRRDLRAALADTRTEIRRQSATDAELVNARLRELERRVTELEVRTPAV